MRLLCVCFPLQTPIVRLTPRWHIWYGFLFHGVTPMVRLRARWHCVVGGTSLQDGLHFHFGHHSTRLVSRLREEE